MYQSYIVQKYDNDPAWNVSPRNGPEKAHDIGFIFSSYREARLLYTIEWSELNIGLLLLRPCYEMTDQTL